MFTKRNVLSGLLAVTFLLTAAAHAAAQQSELLRDEFHQTYPLSADGRVSLENINGAVRITGWDRAEVKVDAVKTAYRRERLDEAKIVVRSDSSSIHIETEYPNRSMNFTDGEGRYDNPATVEYTLMVPRGARVDAIELINGNLVIDGITGDVKASSINGRVSAHELMGDVKLSTVNGHVEAMFGRLNEAKAISLGSVNGPILLTIPSDSNAELRAGTVHGGISNDFGLPVRRGDFVGHDLAGQLGQGGARIKLGNVNGSITIHHAPDGRPLSRATSLLAEKLKDKDDERDIDDVNSEARRAAREVAREAAREAARAQVDARRAQIEAQRTQLEAQRAQQRAQLEAQRATRDGKKDGERARIEAQRIQREARVEAQRAQVEAQRVAQGEVARARVITREEANRIAREALSARAASLEASNTLRLVERESKTFTVSGTPHVTLQTFDGSITVRGWDKQEVQLTISKRSASEQQMRGIQVRADQRGSDVIVHADFDKNFAQRGPVGSYMNALVNLDVYVPRNSLLRLSSGDGHLELEGVNGNLDLDTGDGRIEVRDAGGNLSAKTGDGRIEVQNFNGAVEARTGSGRIILDGRFPQLAARTGEGTIMLTVPADFNATIETDAESIENEGGLTLTEEPGPSRRLKRWKIGRGGNVFTLRTGDGRIILRRVGQ